MIRNNILDIDLVSYNIAIDTIKGIRENVSIYYVNSLLGYLFCHRRELIFTDEKMEIEYLKNTKKCKTIFRNFIKRIINLDLDDRINNFQERYNWMKFNKSDKIKVKLIPRYLNENNNIFLTQNDYKNLINLFKKLKNDKNYIDIIAKYFDDLYDEDTISYHICEDLIYLFKQNI